MRQPTAEPTRKVATGGVVGLVGVVATCAAQHVAGVDVDALVAALGPLVAAKIAEYWVPERDTVIARPPR